MRVWAFSEELTVCGSNYGRSAKLGSEQLRQPAWQSGQDADSTRSSPFESAFVLALKCNGGVLLRSKVTKPEAPIPK